MSSKLLNGLDPVPRTTLSEQVAKRLAARISAGDWKPGEKLPSEAELCKAFNVGRSSLREALTSLAFIGLIRVRAGGGSYVADQPSAYITTPWLRTGVLCTEKSLSEFMEARLILESELAALCAERITRNELQQLEALLDGMRFASQDAQEFSKLDLSFHLAIGNHSKNDVLNKILIGVREQITELISKSLLNAEGAKNALRGHTRIVRAFRDHNPAKAREMMREHLQSFQRGYRVLFNERPPSKTA